MSRRDRISYFIRSTKTYSTYPTQLRRKLKTEIGFIYIIFNKASRRETGRGRAKRDAPERSHGAKKVIFFNRNMIKSYGRTWGGRWAMVDGRDHRTPLALSLTPPAAEVAAAAGEALTRKGAYVQRCVCVGVCGWITNHWETDWLTGWLTKWMHCGSLTIQSVE